MKPLIVSTADITGGAARAAYRLHRGMRALGIDSSMLVQEKFSDDWTVYGPNTDLQKLFIWQRRILEKFPPRLYSNRTNRPFHFAWISGKGYIKEIQKYNPDIVNLHWISRGMLSIENLRTINKPIVWTLQDMWAFTGGCHYSGPCVKYRDMCGACPILNSEKEIDISRIAWQRKRHAWKNLNLVIVTPTRWMTKCVQESSLLRNQRVELIPFGLDLKVFKPIEKQLARNILNLPQDKQIILFGALYPDDPRKGFKYIQTSLEKLKRKNIIEDNKILLAIFGASEPLKPSKFPFQTHFFGKKNDDETLSLIYSAADVMVVPSLQEAFGQTASESLACGTPVVTFEKTGPADIVQHKQSGYTAHLYDSEDLAMGIYWVLNNNTNQILSSQARKRAEQEYGLELQAERYMNLFKELVKK